MPVAMTTFKSKSKRTDLSPQDLPTIPTVQEVASWDEAALLQWIQQEKPKLLRREYLDKFTAAGFLRETFLRRAGDVEYNGLIILHSSFLIGLLVFKFLVYSHTESPSLNTISFL